MDFASLVTDGLIIALFMTGFALFRSPVTARWGNMAAALALAAAFVVVATRAQIELWSVVIAALVVGGTLGLIVAMRVTMLQLPAMVAFQHGIGAVAAFLVSIVELNRIETSGLTVAKAGGLIGLALGAATFTASMVAAGKLAGRMRGTPVVIPGHNAVLSILALLTVVTGVVTAIGGPGLMAAGTIVLLLGPMAAGAVVAIRVGGADMPVLISFLNAAAGLAAAFCGIIISNRLLIACGATVAASGTILTWVMCRAMNRSFLSIVTGPAGGHHAPASSSAPTSPVVEGGPAVATAAPAGMPAPVAAALSDGAKSSPPANPPAASPVARETGPVAAPQARAIAAATAARSVIFVPGYGMALGNAQFEVVKLAGLLEQRGATVCFAIHPVAGRMPGHMNVLLAEADVSYDKLIEMDQANPMFPDTDLVFVVGACDVVNPAAMEGEGTPISGMPILPVHEARQVVVCNLDSRPGYSGVPNSLYARANVALLFGEAKESLAAIISALEAS